MSCLTAPECLRYAWVEDTRWAAVDQGRLQLSPLSLKCDVSRKQGRCETQGSISAPASICVYTHGLIVLPSCCLPVSRWAEQAGGQHRVQNSMSPVLRDHLFLHLTQHGRQQG